MACIDAFACDPFFLSRSFSIELILSCFCDDSDAFSVFSHYFRKVGPIKDAGRWQVKHFLHLPYSDIMDN